MNDWQIKLELYGIEQNDLKICWYITSFDVRLQKILSKRFFGVTGKSRRLKYIKEKYLDINESRKPFADVCLL